MTTINNGGPAFPMPAGEYTANGSCPDGNRAHEEQTGMTLRDYFAAKALQGLLAGLLADGSSVPLDGNEKTAEWSYVFADLMLAARKDGAV